MARLNILHRNGINAEDLRAQSLRGLIVRIFMCMASFAGSLSPGELGFAIQAYPDPVFYKNGPTYLDIRERAVQFGNALVAGAASHGGNDDTLESISVAGLLMGSVGKNTAKS